MYLLRNIWLTHTVVNIFFTTMIMTQVRVDHNLDLQHHMMAKNINVLQYKYIAFDFTSSDYCPQERHNQKA